MNETADKENAYFSVISCIVSTPPPFFLHTAHGASRQGSDGWPMPVMVQAVVCGDAMKQQMDI